MAVAGGLGMAGMQLPVSEVGIALSILVLGLVVAFRLSLPELAAMALVGFFAVFHGHVHGAVMPAAASGVPYAAGFVGATQCCTQWVSASDCWSAGRQGR
jgi:urease accessory protein